jgi:hypothetical protein
MAGTQQPPGGEIYAQPGIVAIPQRGDSYRRSAAQIGSLVVDKQALLGCAVNARQSGVEEASVGFSAAELVRNQDAGDRGVVRVRRSDAGAAPVFLVGREKYLLDLQVGKQGEKFLVGGDVLAQPAIQELFGCLPSARSRGGAADGR